MIMKKGRIMMAGFFLITVIASITYFIFFYRITEKQYDKAMTYFVSRSITKDLRGFDEKIITIRDFVHYNVRPVTNYPNRLDTIAIDKLLSGVGFCDQQSRVFMQLAHNVGITSRLLFLKPKSGPSPHSVAEALEPDGRWIIVDVAYNLDLVNAEGKFASQEDIRKDLNIVKNNEKVLLRTPFEKRLEDNTYLSIYGNEPVYIVTKNKTKFDPLRRVPLSWIRPFVSFIQNKYLEQIHSIINDPYEFKILKARGYHLLGYYDRGDSMYAEIIGNSRDLMVKRKAQYYYCVSLKDQKRYKDSYDYITSIIEKDKENPYREYLYGTKANLLKKMGRLNEAKEDLARIQYSLDAM